MRKVLFVCAVALLAAAMLPAAAELQNVQVTGELRIRGNYVHNTVVSPLPMEVRWPSFLLPYRPIGDMASYVLSGGAPGSVRNNGAGILSPVGWDEDHNDWKFVEQRTRLGVKADFTDDVCAFIELDSYDIWGEDFRSNYVTGADGRAVTTDDVEVFQSYINAKDMWGLPISMRVGRQALQFGNEWLIGDNDDGPMFRGISFDALRLTYDSEVLSIDTWAAKLADTSPVEEDGDVDFYGIYTTFKGIENMTFDAYGLWVRDARRLNDTNFIAPLEWLEDVFELDDYDVTNLYTVGLRGAGVMGPIDFNAEAAYQWGDAGQVGYVFKPLLYGDDDAEFDAWAGTIEMGLTLDMVMQPRLFIGADYFGGEDERDITVVEWLNPFDRPQSSISFNRLFSDKMYSGFFDLNKDMSNVWMGKGGVQVHPTESIMVQLQLTYFEALEAFDSPANLEIADWRIPVAPALSFWTEENGRDIGWETDLVVVYNYTEDLTFFLHWSHLFPGDALYDGSYTFWNGLVSNQGSGEVDGADYITFETRVRF